MSTSVDSTWERAYIPPPKPKGGIIGASLWMLFISLLLCWLPFVGPFIGGFVGGRHTRSMGRAIAAVFLPILVVAILLFFFTDAIIGLPFVGAIISMGATTILVVEVGPILLGAILGALLS